ILHLSLWRLRIVSVFADNHYSIDRELASAQSERFGNGGTEFHPGETLSSFVAQVVRRRLIDVERNKVHGWVMVGSVPSIAFEEAVDDMLGMRILPVYSYNGGEFHGS